MKTIKLTVLLLVLPLSFYAQSLTGLWIGTLSNDSTTIRKDQSFEFVLTQYKDKVYGYSRSTFIVNDTLYYIVKRVKGDIEGDVCEVKDDDIVSHNFPRKPDKGVKQISTFRRNQQDSTWRLDGDWKTNQTKKYYSISGKISLKTEPDIEKSKIFPHLEELKLADDVAFYKDAKKEKELIADSRQTVTENKKQDIVKETKPITTPQSTAKKESVIAGEAKQKEPAKADIAKTSPEPVVTKQPIKEPNKEIVVKEEKRPPVAAPDTKPQETASVPPKKETVVEVKQPVLDVKKEPVKKTEEPVAIAQKETKKEEANIFGKQEPAKIGSPSKPDEQKKEVSTELAKTETKKQETTNPVIVAPKENKPVTSAPEIKPTVSNAAVHLTKRKVAVPQTVLFKSDSLELALYDNGEIDGDTVSVLLNGELILARQGLKASAIKKMIYVPAGKTDSLTLVLYAENLGKYPPNTGLLVIHDGEDVYQVRFSADLQQNAAVIFKRRRN